MAGDGRFDESQHPREEDGKFGSGGGRAGRASSVAKGRAVADKRTGDKRGAATHTPEEVAERLARVESGLARHVTSTDRADILKKERDDIDNENKHLISGDIKPVPTEHFDAFKKVRAESIARVAKTADDLDEAQHDAMKALAKLAEVEDGDHRELRPVLDDDDARSLASSFASSSAHLRNVHSEDEPTDLSGEFHRHLDSYEWQGNVGSHPNSRENDDENPHRLGPSEYDSPEEHAQAIKDHDAQVADYERVLSERKTARTALAESAQTALEKLQAAQAQAVTALKSISKNYDKAARMSSREVDRHEEEQIEALNKRDDDAGPAVSAVMSLADDARARRDNESGEGFLMAARDELRSSMMETTKAIRRIARVTGRPAKVEKPPKTVEDDHNPDDEDDD